MSDTELYRRLLGLESPGEVSRVELSAEGGRIDVWVDHPKRTRFACPVCEVDLSVYDHAEEREWRHLDSCQFLTYLHAKPPRIDCAEHGVLQVRLPWAEPMARFTILFERLAVNVLVECDVAGAGRLLRTSWDETWHLMERAVARGLRVKEPGAPVHLGVDEKSAGRGQDYITIVTDLDKGTVTHIADERRQPSLDSYFDTLAPEHLAGIEAVAMDMWEPYANSVRAHLADEDDKIVFDRFHLMGYLGKAVDTVRKQENRALMAEGEQVPRRVEVSVAVRTGEPAQAPPGALRLPTRYGLEDRQGMGHQLTGPQGWINPSFHQGVCRTTFEGVPRGWR